MNKVERDLTAPVVVTSFPVDELPDWIADKVRELAVATQTDVSMAATSALTALAACCGGRAQVEVHSDHIEQLCLYTVTVAAVAERKSPVQRSMLKPLRAAETDMSLAGEMERLTLADELDMAKATVKRLNRDAVNAASKASRTGKEADKDAALAAADAAKTAKADMRKIEVPVIPRLLAQDASPAALKSLLAKHGGRIAIVSAEGGLFDALKLTKESIDIYTAGHSGDPLMIDRKNQPDLNIPRPALTIGLMVQPRVIEVIGTNRDFVGRGLLARFLYACPVSMIGSRLSDVRPVSKATETRYTARMRKLASDMAGWPNPVPLMLTPLAKTEVYRIQDDNELALVGDGELARPDTLTAWGGKFPGAVVRIAGLIHLAEHGANGARSSCPIQPETIQAAEQIGRYYKACAINVFTAMDDLAEHGDVQDHIDAKKWLNEYLTIAGPQARSSDAKANARKAGIRDRTLQRARTKLGVVIGYEGQPPVSTWTLPPKQAGAE